ARSPERIDETIERVHAIRAATYPGFSVAYLAPDGRRFVAGPWKQLPVPRAIPPWLVRDPWQGSIGLPINDAPGEEDLLVRTVVKVGAGGSGGAVVIDVPVDEQVLHQIYATTGVRLENVFKPGSDLNQSLVSSTSRQGSPSVLFEKSLAQ